MDFQTTQIMGVLNVTPDSFSEGEKRYLDIKSAVVHALQMIDDGATIIDVGGESTRPGASPVSVEEELSRVIPVIEEIRRHTQIPISIDTSKAEVMSAAVNAGANMINDVRALREPGALEFASKTSIPICLMHMQGSPPTMQVEPHYDDVVTEVCSFLSARVDACVRQGIARSRLLVDPGFGFGKSVVQNLQLIKHLDAIVRHINCPVMIGVSRKSTIGQVLKKDLNERLFGGLALMLMARERGARIVRTHDVQSAKEALLMMDSVLEVA